ncbi:MAG: type II toxin-antitoxin system VapC family toxin [Candidatus Omnitrophica bacterium]|nr:type II toxin-antitoxin system VapC family toxin [Candidatus Omnitrophota bacterium]
MTKYLLDTNICIYLIKKRSPKVFARFQSLSVGEVGVSAITYAELEYGVAHSSDPAQNRMALSEFLAPLEILDFQAQVAPIYGVLRTSLVRTGKMIGPLDLLIAAHALHLGVILITNNIKEFSRIADLKIENWV